MGTSLLNTVLAAWSLPDLRKRMLFMLGMFTVYAVGAHVAIPVVNPEKLAEVLSGGALVGFLDMLTGGSLKRFSVFAMGIGPYINASIIMQLMQVVYPKFAELAKEGEPGRRELAKYTRYLTMVLALLQGSGMVYYLSSAQVLQSGAFPGSALVVPIMVVATLMGGTAFLMWMGEELSAKGIGNGISLVIFSGIVLSMPAQISSIARNLISQDQQPALFMFFAVFVAMIFFVVFIQKAERKIPVQYAKRQVGNKVYGGRSSYLPMKVNQAGVIPIIFAVSILLFPSALANFSNIPFVQLLVNKYIVGDWRIYNSLYFFLVVLFTFFYTSVIFNPEDVADNLRKNGGFILGIRPGQSTRMYLEKIMVRLTAMGAVFLGLVAISPALIEATLPALAGVNQQFQLGGTGVLIIVGVALDTVNALEAQMMMRNYEGIMRQGGLLD